RNDPRSSAKSEFLRAELALADLTEADRRRTALQARLRSLRDGIDRQWLALLDRTVIENCRLRFEFLCPKRWEKLQGPEARGGRFCETCRKKPPPAAPSPRPGPTPPRATAWPSTRAWPGVPATWRRRPRSPPA